jgi:hypothetical protein
MIYMPAVRYPKACHDMLYNLEGRESRATKDKHMLSNLGLSFTGLHQGVGDVPSFVNQRLRDISLETWNLRVISVFKLYCSHIPYKTLFNFE